MKNPDYKLDITLTKGGKQFVNIVSSAAFSGILAVIVKEITDKNFKIGNIQSVIDQISAMMIFIVPFVSSGLKMVTNFITNYFEKKE